MKSNGVQVVLSAYLFAICGFLPLYVHNGYNDIGTAKFTAYAVITVLMLIAFGLAYFCSHNRQHIHFDAVDYALLAFVSSQALAYVFSVDRSVSAWGIDGWYTGVIPYLLMCATAFIYRHFYVRSALVIPLMLAGLAVPIVLAVLNSLGLSVVLPMVAGRLSTIGNANWFAGYDSVFMALATAAALDMMCGKTNRSAFSDLVISISPALAVLGAFACNSESIFLSLAVLLALCVLIAFGGSSAGVSQRVRRWLPLAVVALCVVTLAVQMSGVLPYKFGNGRGTLWAVGTAVFDHGSVIAKVFGHGQDTFSTVIAANENLQYVGGLNDWGVRVTNCHSWMLTALCDSGLAGLCTSLFLIHASLNALCNRNDAWTAAGVFVIVSVLADLSVSFSQVMVTPYLFLIAGIALGRSAGTEGGSLHEAAEK